MRKNIDLFFFLMKNKITFFIIIGVLYLLIIPSLMFFLKTKNSLWNYTELMVRIVYQVFYVMLSGISYILFMQDLIEEGREIFYINKRMYLPESFMFTAISCVLLHLSLNISGIWEQSVKEYIFL